MASEWREVRLGEVAEFINGDRGHNYPSPTSFVETGIPFISAADLVDGRVLLNGARRISQPAFDRLGSGKVQDGDLLFCLRGSLGRTARVVGIQNGAIASSLVIIRPSTGIDSRYLYYLLAGPFGQRLARALNNGSVQPNISAQSLAATRIPLPNISEQHRIAGILGALDDKIELNRRMSQTLESMARGLFEASVGREERVAPLNEMVESAREQVRPFDFPDRVFDHYSIPAFDGSGLPANELGRHIKSAKWLVSPDTVLLSKLNPEIERVWLPDVASDRTSVCSTEFLVLRPVPPTTQAFLYCLLRSAGFRDRLQSLASGTTGSRQRAHSDAVLGLLTPVLGEGDLRRFDRAAAPVLGRALHGRREAALLSSIRDRLLPMLISGVSSMDAGDSLLREVAS